jgi:hypothetical protein
VALQLIGLVMPTGGGAGSTVDSMSDAIEGADVMLYGVSLAYKESANVSGLPNLRVSGSLSVCCSPCMQADAVVVACIFQCRMEANYAHQQELDMIPLLMQKDYSPKGYVVLNYSRLCTLRELVQGFCAAWPVDQR